MCILKLLPFQGVWGVASAFQGVWAMAAAFCFCLSVQSSFKIRVVSLSLSYSS